MPLQSRRFTVNLPAPVCARLEQAARNAPPIVAGESSRGAVRAIQQALIDLNNPDFSPGTADGIFGQMTKAAVMKFQKNFHLIPDGTVGAQTMGTLDRLYADDMSGSAKGIAIHLGLNAVDPEQYSGWSGVLHGCENDARDMETICRSQNFQTKTFLTKEATSQVLFTELQRAAQCLTSGDILVLTYSGHGGQVPNTNGDDESDGMDETWCLFDREVIDDELHAAFGRFAAGVRVLLFSDSCHSGTVARVAEARSTAAAVASPFATLLAPTAFRVMPMDVRMSTYEAHKAMYDGLQSATTANDRAEVSASVVLISGCQDNQLSGDMATNGVFTAVLKLVWANGSFQGDYRRFHSAIAERMPSSQQPNLFTTGAPADGFLSQKPFSI